MPDISVHSSNMSNIEHEVEEWADCSPDTIIKLLKALENGDRGENPKEFYTSYPVWDKMSGDQKTKSKKYFQKLTAEKQKEILLIAKDRAINQKSVEHKRNAAVTKKLFSQTY